LPFFSYDLWRKFSAVSIFAGNPLLSEKLNHRLRPLVRLRQKRDIRLLQNLGAGVFYKLFRHVDIIQPRKGFLQVDIG